MSPPTTKTQKGLTRTETPQIILNQITKIPSQFSLMFIITHLIVALALVMTGILLIKENSVVAGVSKRFLKGFIMGAMFAHHHKP
jgi:hypothetical protein